MYTTPRRGLTALAFMTLLAAGCGGGGGSSDTARTEGDANRAPVANPGSDRIAVVGNQITLNGSASSDPDGDPLSYAWTIRTRPAGSQAVLQNGNTVTPSITPDVAGSYLLNLVVSDGQLPSAPTTLMIAATDQNVPPVANAGAAQTVIVGSLVTLNGSGSTDANGDQITYAWRVVSQPAGSSVSLSAPTSVAPAFTPLVVGDYLLGLTVNDGKTSSSESTVSISAQAGNVAPVANAGISQNVLVGNLVTLDGSASSDANSGDQITYAWSLVTQPSGSTVSLSGASTVRPTFTPQIAGTYVAALVVSDGQVSSQTAFVTVNASVANVAPVANAGIDQGVVVNTLVTLNGSASSDANPGDQITYAWRVVSQPAGSNISLSDTGSVAPTFTPLIAGSYVFGLTVSDGRLTSTEDTVAINASAANVAPSANAGSNQSVFVGSLVTLDGSASSDANPGDQITYAWNFTSRPTDSAATLSGSTSALPTFTPDRVGSYVVTLIVSDGRLSSTSVVTITASVENVAPVANAGIDQGVVVNTLVTLNGSASADANTGDQLTYTWRIVAQPATSSISLSDTRAIAPTFTPAVAGGYVFGLTVSDGRLTSTEDTVAITASAANVAPVARIGAVGPVLVGDTVTLDGSTSSDPNDDQLSHAWTLVSIPAGSATSLQPAANVVSPQIVPDRAGTYVLVLIVSDGQLSSAPATVTVTASNPNGAPTAVATGPAQNPLVGDTVTLSGSGSSDPDAGTMLTYSWALTRPAGSNAVLSNPSAVSPSFVADAPGTYTATLTVSDGSLGSLPATVNINVDRVTLGPLAFSTSAFADGAEIAANYRCQDPGTPSAMLPPLSWQNLPYDTRAVLVLAERVIPSTGELSLLHLIHVPDASGYFAAGMLRSGGGDQPGEFPFVSSITDVVFEASDSPPCVFGETYDWTLYALTQPVSNILALQAIINAISAAHLAGDLMVLHTADGSGDPVPRLTRAGFEEDFAEFIAASASFSGFIPQEQ